MSEPTEPTPEPAAEPATRPARKERELDVVLFGASGFVGHLTAAHLAGRAPSGLRAGLAGRSEERLRAGRARVVVTTAGPYLRYGLGLAGACADAGTHYADLTQRGAVRPAGDRPVS